jgi:hypothetical protein
MAYPTPIASKKLIVAEGKHAVQFLRWACRIYRGGQDVQVQGGNGLNTIAIGNIEGFDQSDKFKELILNEDEQAEQFLRWACMIYKVERDIQIKDGGGVRELRRYLRTLKNVEGFDQLETLVVARDAESSADDASNSICDAFRELGLPIPDKAFSYASANNKRTAFIIFPGPNVKQGNLEDLCLKLVSDNPILSCVDTYLTCIKEKNRNLTSTHDSKRKISTFLAGQEDKDIIGTNVGQAAHSNAWNAGHPALKPFKEIIVAM